MTTPTQEQLEEFLLSCRYGELEEVEAFTKEFGWESINSFKDDRGNTALHMCCANGHVDVLNHLLPNISPDLISRPNNNGSPPIHWAVFNGHVNCVKALAELPEEKGGGLAVLKLKNRAGRDAFAEALFAGEGKEEVAGWIEGFLCKAEGWDDEIPDQEESGEGEGEIKLEAGDEVAKDEAETVDEIVEKTGEVSLEKST